MGCLKLTYQKNNFLNVVHRKNEQPQKKSVLDYFSGGMAMPNRNVVGDYRYGYQGEYSEKDEETGHNAFQLRMYDSRINRWISPDPYGQYHSPYMAMDNRPNMSTDPTGGCTDCAECPSACQDLGVTSIPSGQSIDLNIDTGYFLQDGVNSSMLGEVSVFSVSSNATVNVLTETDGIGHTYIQIGGIVFSNGRYNGSDSPSMGAYGLTGDNVLIRKTGQEAQDFLNQRTNKYPTTVQTVNNVDASKVFKDLNSRYNDGTPNPNGPGVIDGRYNLLTRNCTTSSCVALKAGGVNVHAVAPKALPVQINLSNQGIDPKQYFENARFEALRGPKF